MEHSNKDRDMYLAWYIAIDENCKMRCKHTIVLNKFHMIFPETVLIQKEK